MSLFGKGERLVLAPLYLGSFFDKLDECAKNVVYCVGHHNVAIYANASLLQMLIWDVLDFWCPGLMSSTLWIRCSLRFEECNRSQSIANARSGA